MSFKGVCSTTRFSTRGYVDYQTWKAAIENARRASEFGSRSRNRHDRASYDRGDRTYRSSSLDSGSDDRSGVLAWKTITPWTSAMPSCRWLDRQPVEQAEKWAVRPPVRQTTVAKLCVLLHAVSHTHTHSRRCNTDVPTRLRMTNRYMYMSCYWFVEFAWDITAPPATVMYE